MITEMEIREVIKEGKNKINMKDTAGFSSGRLNRYLSKAFVAGIGEYFQKKYDQDDYETRFQGFHDGKGVSGEWLYDAIVVQMRGLSVENKQLRYPFKIEVVIESEFASGIQAFVDDFTKLLMVKAGNKIYINGVKRLKNKEAYIEERMKLIKAILAEQSDDSNYFICFIDHPALWKNDDIFIQIFNL